MIYVHAMKYKGIPVIYAGVPADLDLSQNGPLGPNPLANMDRGVDIR